VERGSGGGDSLEARLGWIPRRRSKLASGGKSLALEARLEAACLAPLP
jgi:hypothetical protein